ncbi:MAG: RND family transporter [Deltaproteobacteria bacterium]|nr:RND family transporter [Deltaproteobacteria bacterium]
MKPSTGQPSALLLRIEALIFGHRRWVLGIFAALTAFFCWSAFQLRVDAGFAKLLPLKHPYIQTFLKYQQDFGGANRVLVALMAKDGDIFTPEFLDALRRATDDVFFVPGVDRSHVSSLWTPDVRYREVTEEGLAGGNVIPADYQPDAKGVEQVRKNVLRSDAIGRLVANDYKGAIISADLVDVDPGTGERLDYIRVAHDLEKIRKKYEKGNVEVHIIGFAKMIGDMADGAARVMLFLGVTFLITAVLVYRYTRSLSRTVVLLLCAVTAVIWQVGLLHVLGFGIDPMGMLVPFLVFAMAVSHGVQKIVTAEAEIYEGANSLDAARGAFRKMFGSALAALATNVAGFLTILLIDVRIIQEMALTATLGVAIIIVTDLVLLPVALSYAGISRSYREKLQDRSKAMEPFWRVVSKVAEPRSASAVIFVALALLVFGIWKGEEIQVGDVLRGVPELRPKSRYNVDTQAISDHFSIGVDILTVFAETKPEGCMDPEVMGAIDRFEWHMQNVEGVHAAVSLPSVVKIVTSGWNEGSLKWRVLPRGQHLLAQALGYIPTSSGLLNRDASVLPVYLFTADHKAETIERVLSEAKAFDKTHGNEKVRFRLAGGNVGVMGATNEEVAAEHYPILLWVFAAVIFVSVANFRSWRATLCIVVPLAIVSMLGYALMALLKIGLKVNTLPIISLGVGVGVDYAIYIYGRLEVYLAQGKSLRRAYELALDVNGSGVVLTATTLAIGTAMWIFSPLKFQADMGILLTFLFVVNMIGALFLTPALASWLLPARMDQEPAASPAAEPVPAENALGTE